MKGEPDPELEKLEALQEGHKLLSDQITKLANFIQTEIPGEPSRSEGAVDCAIRLLTAYRSLLRRTALHIAARNAMGEKSKIFCWACHNARHEACLLPEIWKVVEGE